MERDSFFSAAEEEAQAARLKFSAFHSTHEGYAVILEEVDELWDAIRSNYPAWKLREELIQIAAMCACFADELLP